jgi:transposase-like protein
MVFYREKGSFMKSCKGCGSKELVKNGKDTKGTQKYKCKSCGGTFRDGDKRIKHGLDKRIKVIKMYLEGVGIRSIERLEGVSNPLIIYWIRHFSDIVRKEIKLQTVPDKVEDIEILEVDELFSFYKKSKIEFTSGLLLTETGIKLLMSR